MAWKSFPLAAGIVSTAALPFYAGSAGGANLPDGPCIVAANHSSFVDGPLLALAYAGEKFRPLHMIAYEEPFGHWLMGWILRSAGAIPFRRGDRASQGRMLATALGWLAAGEAVGVFPEGHVNQAPRLGRPRRGAALLALESGLPVIPAAIIGSRETLPVGALFPRPFRKARVCFGLPIALFPKELAYAGSSPGERKTMIANLGFRIMRAIAELAGREFWDGD